MGGGGREGGRGWVVVGVVASMQESGYTVTLVTVEVGDEGSLSLQQTPISARAGKQSTSCPGPVGRQLKVPTGFGV